MINHPQEINQENQTFLFSPWFSCWPVFCNSRFSLSFLNFKVSHSALTIGSQPLPSRIAIVNKFFLQITILKYSLFEERLSKTRPYISTIKNILNLMKLILLNIWTYYQENLQEINPKMRSQFVTWLILS